MAERYVCIHGHFYQPPRENAWLEAVELQDSAYPHHDWNQRITAECYAPNAASRLLDDEKRIRRIVSNYSRISFNFGPTLLSWMDEHAPETYRAILEADQESLGRFHGHGSAIAQAYGHLILPLANRRDKRTQVRWGLRDFEHRFGRAPEGMWLPETAVDLESLDVLAEHGIRYTILAPHQARRVKAKEQGEWRDVDGLHIDPSRAYEIRLPSRRSMAVFFYDGPISRAVAFERLLHSGESFAGRLLSALSDQRTWPQLAHIATDGETYGHHHRHGEMALAYALESIESGERAELINYGAYLERHPPTHLVEIVEDSSWSCTHGIERWRSDCGCNTGRDGWSQAWRVPLREALDWLRDRLASGYERMAATVLRDPWAARDEYVELILDRSPETVRRFLERNAMGDPGAQERVALWKLLELQRHAMSMFTSCGWFFDDLSGIETVQVLQYAGRAMQLAREVLDEDPEPEFLDRLASARSNVPGEGDGRKVYERRVKPAMVDLAEVAAHYAVSRLFEDYGQRTKIFGYVVDRHDERLLEAGTVRLGMGRVRVASLITEETACLSYGVLHFGDHNLTGGVREFQGEAPYGAMLADVEKAFSSADLPGVLRRLDKHFLEMRYSLKSLFRDEQRKVLERILEPTLGRAGEVYGRLYDTHAALMRFLTDLGIPLPAVFRAAGENVINSGLRRAFESEEIDVERAERLLEEARQENVGLDREGLGLALQTAIERDMERVLHGDGDVDRLRRIEHAARLISADTFDVNPWKIENLYYEMMQNRLPVMRERTEAGDEDARAWVKHFRGLGEALRFRIG
jgi:alpha-amylase/alpha-mannosidase (GH57 family)